MARLIEEIELDRSRQGPNTSEKALRNVSILTEHHECLIRLNLLQQPDIFGDSLPLRGGHSKGLQPLRIADEALVGTHQIELPRDRPGDVNRTALKIDAPKGQRNTAARTLRRYATCSRNMLPKFVSAKVIKSLTGATV
jgi:hypothetical protein